MSSRTSAVLVAAAVFALAAAGCAKHAGVPAPTFKAPVVFDDGFGIAVDYQAFAGSKLDAIAIDSTEAHSGSTSLRFVVPAAGDPSGTYSGGAFTTNRARDLSGYDALVFWAKANRTVNLDVAGLGNDNTGTSRYEARRTFVTIGTDWTRIVIPIPLASRLVDERGMFYLAEGPEAGQGATIWLDDIRFEQTLTVSNPRPAINSATLTPDVGSFVTVPGTRVVFAVDGGDVLVSAMQGYFTFVSSADSVAVGGEGTVQAVGLGTATVTASLGGLPATGVLTITPKPAPLSAAPAPTVPAADVISLFSNAYSNVAVNNWSTTWDGADVTDTKLFGDDVKLYTILSYAAAEFTGANTINATAMTHFHLDVWAATGTTFRVKLVDFGANGNFGGGDDREHELTFNTGTTPAFQPGVWSSLEIPLSNFTGLTTRAHLAQLILAGDVGSVYVDNIYFHK